MTEQLDFYVYEHRRSDTGEVFYVGAGRGNRAFVRAPSKRSREWRDMASDCGFTVRIIHDGLSRSDALALEAKVIASHGRDALVNKTDGGAGTPGLQQSSEVVEHRAAKLRGRKHSDETKMKMSARQRGPLHHNYGKPAHPKVREAVSKAMKGRPKSDEQRAKMTKSRRERSEKVTLFHPDHGTVTAYQADFVSTYGLLSSKLSNVVTGKRLTHAGWRLLPVSASPS